MFNATPSLAKDKDGISPIELFAQTQVAARVKHSHTFGSPVYVLDAELQQGQRVGKWKERARIGIYLGASPRHSRKVALVLSLMTGHVSPQFHCVFDDMFETLRKSSGNPRPLCKWTEKTGFTDSDATNLDSAEIGPEFVRVSIRQLPAEMEIVHEEQGKGLLPVDPVDPVADNDADHYGQTQQQQQRQQRPADASTEERRETRQRHQSVRIIPQYIRASRSGRQPRPIEKLLMCVSWDVYDDNSNEELERLDHPISFAASSNPDILYLDDAMRAPDAAEFRKAMAQEIKSHTDNGHWQIVDKSSVPGMASILPAVWAFRRKRWIKTQEVYKWKARLNVHGGRQEHGVNYWETHAPAVGWSMIRLFLNLMILNRWVSRQVDFVLAFPQADIECDMYMEISAGGHLGASRRTKCLKLIKNLYGQKQAGCVWNQHMHDGLVARGFEQSEVDMCVYYRESVTLMMYTDDGIFMVPNQSDIDYCFNLLTTQFVHPITKVKHRAFKMTDEGDVSDYLGVEIQPLPNGTIKLSQPHLINQIIADLGFNERTGTKNTPASKSVKLNRDLHGAPFMEEWNYRSVIGKLNFLEKSTRCDLSYSVHQCAWFSAHPRQSHAIAVKRIVKCLILTRDKGVILNPQRHSFDCWVDADFVGNWDRVNADVDPSTAQS